MEEPTRSNKTLLIAVAAGVVALGVLGGATALVLGGEDTPTDVLALPPSSVVPVEPSVAPTATPTPLPTTLVKGRNVFIPLVEAGTGAAGEAVVDPVAAAAPTATPTSGSGTGSTVGSFVPSTGGGSFVPSSGGGSVVVSAPAPTVTVTEVATEVVQDDQLVTQLRGKVVALEKLLTDLDNLATEEIEGLEAEIADLKQQIKDAEGTPAYDATVRLLSVDPDEDGEVLSLQVNGVDVILDLVETEGDAGALHPSSTPLYRTGTGQIVKLRYVDYVAADKLVTFVIGSEEYEALLGTTLVYSRR